MERIILIETSTALCSTALSENGAIVSYRESSAPKAHASLTAVFIQEMLSERGLTIEDCDAVCVSMGPGSYTGLRVGVSTAKGLCFGSGKPLLAVGTLDTLVAQADDAAHDLTDGLKYTIPMVDARRMEVYSAVFENGEEILSPCVRTIDEIKDWDWEDAFSKLMNSIFFMCGFLLKCNELFIKTFYFLLHNQ